ncbi:MAG: YafY family protein [Devosia sp.]
MSRTERLLELLQVLRRHRAPVAGATLAADLNVSLRTLYRDIATLQGQGAEIAGEPGLGYVLRPGFMLPPLMFSIDELEALILGAQWTGRQTDDSRLSKAAGNALVKIAAVLPDDLRREIDSGGLYVTARRPTPVQVDPALLRDAIRKELRLRIGYRDDAGQQTERVIWPFVIGFFEQHKVVAAWCELRNDYRNFRIDRIATLAATGERAPRRRHALLKEWRELRNVQMLERQAMAARES